MALIVIPTPIGNLEDITMRALRLLKEVSVVYAEDTRTTRRLFDHYGITTQLRPFHSFNEHTVVERIADEVESGLPVGLVSDAGTPGISDPGFLLVRACVRRGLRVECLPGATAFVPALVASGLPSDTFHFEGFLPHKKGRQTRLRLLGALPHTFILYESPYRLLKCLDELIENCGPDRPACVARELTKMLEEVKIAPLSELKAHFSAKEIKGEIVVVVAGLEREKEKEQEKDRDKERKKDRGKDRD